MLDVWGGLHFVCVASQVASFWRMNSNVSGDAVVSTRPGSVLCIGLRCGSTTDDISKVLVDVRTILRTDSGVSYD